MTHTNTPDYQATLAGWWENADPNGPVGADDQLIIRDADGDYAIEKAYVSYQKPAKGTRILSRAPKPRPAWHNAPAVIAHTEDDRARRVFIPADPNSSTADTWWDAPDSLIYGADDLIDPVPLIEARVTDEMVQRARADFEDATGEEINGWAMSSILAAALGIGDDK
jgi:hypothetical protein